jgi:uncharacterized protein (TIGR03435 family)
MRKRLGYWPYRTRQILVVACAGLLIRSSTVGAQTTSSPEPEATNAKAPAYDVVSIKPDKTGSGQVDVWIDDGNFTAANLSLKMMILGAWGLKDAQLLDLPKWGDSARFDIKAKIIDPDKKALSALTPEQFRSMQQPILTDRFQLKFHRGKKVLPIYDLVVIKGGPKFKEATAAYNSEHTGFSIHNRNLTATAVTLSSLADHLSDQVGRIVIDKTGLAGKYNLQLNWSPDDARPPAADTSTPPDIFTALEEQLGLKLQLGNAEIETFVIDHAEVPSEN